MFHKRERKNNNSKCAKKNQKKRVQSFSEHSKVFADDILRIKNKKIKKKPQKKKAKG